MQFPYTIFALSSGRPPAGVAVVRVSGGLARSALERITGRIPSDRRAVLADFRNADGGVIDRGLALFFPEPASFTGEDCAEFHLHGGRAVVEALSGSLLAFDGMRPAEPGEFTRRAFLNGKMDLTEAEALADLINAETEAQRRFAVASAGGAQSELYAGWRKRIVHARAMIEAELDFADESDVPGSVSREVWADAEELAVEIERHIAGFHRAEMIREGFSVVIIGAPNAGKSSLLNALARREVAIVTDEPGTTRDLVQVALDLHGVKVIVTDTAGIREGAGKVEAIGIERAQASARDADLVIALEDVAVPVRVALPEGRAEMLRIGSKADLLGANYERPLPAGLDLLISVRTGAGLDALVEAIWTRADRAVGGGDYLLPARARHVALLNDAVRCLRAALADGAGLELRAEELRRAGEAFGKIAGTVGVEEVLGVIFSEFCIGK
jgi:tRNA modification GTPase